MPLDRFGNLIPGSVIGPSPVTGVPPEAQNIQSAAFGSLAPQGGQQQTLADLFYQNPDLSPGDRATQATQWQNTPADPNTIQQILSQGYHYQTPAMGNPLLSSGPQGGWFSGAGQILGAASSGPGAGYYQGYGGSPQAGGPPPGMVGPSTNNWRLLPQGFNTPQYSMRMGHIINNRFADSPLWYVNYNPAGASGAATEGTASLGGPGEGYPMSFGSGAVRGYFYPGQMEPWDVQGGTGIT